MANTVATVLSVFVLMVGLMMGLTVADGIVSSSDGATGESNVQTAQQLQGTQFVRLDALGSGDNETVRNSRGKALFFDGSTDATMQAETGIDIHERDNWSVATTVWVNASATGENLTLVTEGDPNIYLRYAGNRSTPHWQVIFHSANLTQSYLVEVTATDPTNRTHIFAQRDGDTLYVFENDTADSTSIDGSSDAIPDLTADQNLHGRLDETRMFANVLTPSQRTQLQDSPNDGITGVNHRARITYDEYLRNTGEVRVWWTPASATLGTGTAFVDGLAGEELEEKTLANDIAGTSDYAWRQSGPQIRAVDGGQLDGSPVAYVQYDFSAQAVSVVNSFGEMVSLAALGGLIAVAGLIIGRLRNA